MKQNEKVGIETVKKCKGFDLNFHHFHSLSQNNGE
jgi:hypothetical protein